MHNLKGAYTPMKKTLAILLALACLLGCTGCSNKGTDSKGSADETISSFIKLLYGEPETLSYSFAGKLFEL